MNAKLLGLPLLCLCLLVLVPAASAATITVNNVADTAANDGVCTLREAITAANTDTASGGMIGECVAGSGADTIAFDATFTGTHATSTIANGGGIFPVITQPVTIAGGNCGSPKPCVGIDANINGGLNVEAANVTISGVAIFDAGIAIIGPDNPGLVVKNTWLGMSLDEAAAGNSNGILIPGDNAVIGGPSANDRNVIAKTDESAIRIVGAHNTTIQGNYLGTKADGTTTTGVGNRRGVQVVGDTGSSAPAPVGTVIGGPEAGVPGTCDAPCNVIVNNINAAIDLQGGGGTEIPAGQTAIEGNFIGLGVAGADLGTGGITVGDADNVTVGGDAARRNYVATEVAATMGATNLDVVANFVGLNPSGTARIDDDATLRIGDQGAPITGANVTGNRIARASGGAGAPIALTATSSLVQGNVIGVGTGGENVGGGTSGIFVNGGSGNQIGGGGAGEGNVIGNAQNAITAATDSSTIAGNVIGTDATQTQSHPVTAMGIFVGGGTNNVIGGTTAAGENLVVNVAEDAIRVIGDGTDFNRILRNRGSGGAAQEFVDLIGNGPGNAANGPNQGIERPVITAGATSQQVSGTGALAGATVRVYRTASTAGATGPRDVIAYAGQATADGSGNWTLNCPSAGCDGGLPGGGQVTANQTAISGSSSEMADPKGYTDLAPDTQIDSGPETGTTTGDSTPTFGFSASEPDSTFECRIDAAAFAACSGPGATHTTAALGDGQHTFEVRAVDNALNTDPTAASRAFTVDATAPDTQIDSGPAAGTTIGDSTPTFGFSATEAGSTFECRVDGAAFAACSGPGATHTPAALTDGQHTFEVRGADAVGNVDATPASRGFTVDATAPDTQVDSGPAAGTTTADSTPSFGFSATEAGSTFECRIDAAAFAACSGPGATHTTAALGDGAHTFEVRATDALGNLDATPATRVFTVDTAPPQTTIASGPAAGSFTRDRTPTFGLSASEAGSSFECRVDAAAFAACSGPGASHTPAALANGRHTFEVRAKDAVGNVDTTPASRAFTVDRDPPETTITKRPRKNTTNRVARFRFRSDERGSTFRCKLDKGRFKRCSSPFRKRVKPGRHILRVRAVDRAGNADPTPAKARWTVRR